MSARRYPLLVVLTARQAEMLHARARAHQETIKVDLSYLGASSDMRLERALWAMLEAVSRAILVEHREYEAKKAKQKRHG